MSIISIIFRQHAETVLAHFERGFGGSRCSWTVVATELACVFTKYPKLWDGNRALSFVHEKDSNQWRTVANVRCECAAEECFQCIAFDQVIQGARSLFLYTFWTYPYFIQIEFWFTVGMATSIVISTNACAAPTTDTSTPSMWLSSTGARHRKVSTIRLCAVNCRPSENWSANSSNSCASTVHSATIERKSSDTVWAHMWPALQAKICALAMASVWPLSLAWIRQGRFSTSTSRTNDWRPAMHSTCKRFTRIAAWTDSVVPSAWLPSIRTGEKSKSVAVRISWANALTNVLFYCSRNRLRDRFDGFSRQRDAQMDMMISKGERAGIPDWQRWAVNRCGHWRRRDEPKGCFLWRLSTKVRLEWRNPRIGEVMKILNQ